MKTKTSPKRIMSMLLVLMMVLTLLPTTAFAIETVESVSATVTAPVAGANPLSTATSGDTDKYTASVSFAEGTGLPPTSEPLGDGQEFEANTSYVALVVFEAEDGYDFVDTTTATINGQPATFYHRESGIIGFYVVFSTSSTDPEDPEDPGELVPTVSAEVTAPVAGANPSFDATSGDTDKYTASVSFAEGTGLPPTSESLSGGQEFEANTSYIGLVVFEAKDGYKFADTTTATINGHPATFYHRESGIIGFYVVFTLSAPPLSFADNAAYDIPSGEAGTTYTATTALTATGGVSPYSFTIETPVTGLSINTDKKLVYVRPATATAPTTVETTATIKVTDGAGANETITIQIGEVTAKPVTPVLPFVDVPEDAYYRDAVVWAFVNAITNGTSATTFEPESFCTRAQAVTFLWRATGSPVPTTTVMPFNDVPVDSYYYNAVLWAVEQGIIKGTSAITFSPDMNCSRAHIVTMLWRMEGSKAATVTNPFTDVSDDAYYTDAVLWAVETAVTNGTSATTFSPDDNGTRAHIVTFIYRDMK